MIVKTACHCLILSLIISTVLTILTYTALPIMMWIALRYFAPDSSAAALAFLGIPDITVPQWIPAWDGTYITLSLLTGLIVAGVHWVGGWYDLPQPFFDWPIPMLQIALPIIAVLLSLVVPAGVTLLLLTLYIGRTMAVAIAERSIKARGMPKVTLPLPTPNEHGAAHWTITREADIRYAPSASGRLPPEDLPDPEPGSRPERGKPKTKRGAKRKRHSPKGTPFEE